MATERTRWSPTPSAARLIQERLRVRVETVRRADELGGLGGLGERKLVVGVDCGLSGGRVRAALAVYRFPELVCIEEVVRERRVRFPYVPGLLAFRELPAILAAWRALRARPDVLLVDGHGLAHPRRFGLASHLGVLLDRPAIGCGKGLLVGEHRRLGRARGARAELLDRGEVVGLVLRTRQGVRPVYVSIGHRVDLDFAAELALACVTRFRLPEPVRRADALASRRGIHSQ